jgi:hypothetical protein
MWNTALADASGRLIANDPGRWNIGSNTKELAITPVSSWPPIDFFWISVPLWLCEILTAYMPLTEAQSHGEGLASISSWHRRPACDSLGIVLPLALGANLGSGAVERPATCQGRKILPNGGCRLRHLLGRFVGPVLGGRQVLTEGGFDA